jgi:hypothetical protein
MASDALRERGDNRMTHFAIRFRASAANAAILASLLLFESREARAQTIDDAISNSTGVTYTLPTSDEIDPVIGAGADLPVFFNVGTYSGQTQTYGINGTVSGSFTYADPGSPFATQALVDVSNASGDIFLSSTATLDYSAAPASVAQGLGDAALRVVSQPLAVSGSLHENGGIVRVDNGGDITVAGNGTRNATGTVLDPAGFRTADLSGIVALSYGKQGTGNDTSHPSGDVTVNHSGATIAMSQTDSSIITAGISAATMSGEGSAFDTVNYTATVRAALNLGSITNSADSGVGILAMGSGGRLLVNQGSTAFGNDVEVTLHDASSILMTGTTGVGVFASSVVYMPGEAKMSSASQAGSVTVTLDNPLAAIGAGSANSKYSIGVLAVSAGTAAFLDPYGTHETSGSGVGNANAVQITNSGTVGTYGQTSIGLAGLSLGGPATVTTNASTGQTYLGINGADADGAGNNVTITNNAGASVVTVGESAHGIVALSSGSGGIVVNEQAAAGDASDPDAATGLAVGNNSTSGGTGSAGGTVLVTNNGSVLVGDGNGTGINSAGILAQSIGGGGGNASGQAALFVGDKGGKGGNGGAVTVNIGAAGSVHTKDSLSVGILAQSIGGGGGNGGNASGIFVAVGGKGGSGGSGGAVGLDITGSVKTDGMHSAGVIAQSIGGGGGNGGTATSWGLVINTSIGGKAANGSPGGAVNATVENTGSIHTLQNNSSAMILQSVGGGGGTGGAAISQSVSMGLGISFALGGNGGGGGVGGTATGRNYGSIITGTQPADTSGAPTVDGADSYGMLAQSIGGGGGHAGAATSKDLVAQLPTMPANGDISGVAIAVSVAVGGTGGGGGDGGQASLTNYGAITTWGDGSGGMVAQSVGGGGGRGGDSTAGSLLLALNGKAASFDVGVGGSAGSGGHGDAALATNSLDSTIVTHGQNASGITAQSIGGGGGIGAVGTGNAHDPTLSPLNLNTYTTTIGVGGAGGNGGHAGYTNVENDGAITTTGSGSEGILAQSIGGGGGTAKGGAAEGSNSTVTFNLALGSSGGDGGSATTTENFGYSVSVTNFGSIQTSGGDGTGIVAQSIGGGGGVGGSSDANSSIGDWSSLGSLLFTKGLTPHITLGVSAAGSGGTGGAGGNVLVNQSGSIGTSGSRAYGVLAQSISGGGGQGGHASAQSNPGLFAGWDRTLNFETDIAVGGNGGDANNGGRIEVDTSGAITTSGYGSHGIVAQSVAGGGGVGGDGTPDIGAILGLGIGANRAAGGTASSSGGEVTVSPGANITSTGGNAYGILAQSVGGGGGVGTVGAMPSLVTADFTAGALPIHMGVNFGINQSNSGASNGGLVTVNPTHALKTSGDWALGLVAQSIGAGGGKGDTITGTNSNASSELAVQLGASNGRGDGSTVKVDFNSGSISTGTTGANATGYGAMGLVAQSIGGGGGLFTDGSSGATGTMTLGISSSQAKGAGGAVTVTGTGGSVETQADYAFGVVAQSIGGGGGIAASGSTQTYQGTGTPGVGLSVGSNDGDGTGGTVTYNANALVTTHGANAFGVVAQSIGGGGGIAFAKASTTNFNLGMTNASLSSDHYNGGTVNVTIPNASAITTSGAGAHGVIAQSIGGGGGIVEPDTDGGLSTIPTAINGVATALGWGGNVGVAVDGNVTTTGSGSVGVLAQSVSGGGGLFSVWVGSTGGSSASGGSSTNDNSGDVAVTQGATSAISAAGGDSVGILAQNVTAGGHGVGRITVTTSGSVVGGSGNNGTGVWIDGGNSSNTLTVNSGSTVSSGSGTAVHYTGSSKLTVTNAGTIDGSIILNASSTVSSSGMIKGASSILGDVTNSGTLALLETPIELTITGTLTQNASGLVQLGVQDTSTFGSINVTSTAHYQGGLQVTFSYLPDEGASYTLLKSGTGTYSFSSVEVLGLPQSATWTTSISGNDYILQITAVPEPGATAAAFGVGLLLLVVLRRVRLQWR